MIHVGGAVMRLCGDIPPLASPVVECFTSRRVALDALGSLNHRNSRRVELARSSLRNEQLFKRHDAGRN